MRAKSCQSQGIGIRLAIDQQQVRLDVAFPVASPIAGKIVVTVACVKGLVGASATSTGLEGTIECGAVQALGLTFV